MYVSYHNASNIQIGSYYCCPYITGQAGVFTVTYICNHEHSSLTCNICTTIIATNLDIRCIMI